MIIKKCAIKECQKRAEAKTLCSSHYHRLLRYGDPKGSSGKEQTFDQLQAALKRFYAKK